MDFWHITLALYGALATHAMFQERKRHKTLEGHIREDGSELAELSRQIVKRRQECVILRKRSKKLARFKRQHKELTKRNKKEIPYDERQQRRCANTPPLPHKQGFYYNPDLPKKKFKNKKKKGGNTTNKKG